MENDTILTKQGRYSVYDISASDVKIENILDGCELLRQNELDIIACLDYQCVKIR